jgi:hypothetical protein
VVSRKPLIKVKLLDKIPLFENVAWGAKIKAGLAPQVLVTGTGLFCPRSQKHGAVFCA